MERWASPPRQDGRDARPSTCRHLAQRSFLLLSHSDYDKRIRQWLGPSPRILRTRLRRRAQVGGHGQHLSRRGVKRDGARAFLSRNVLDQRILSVAFADEAHVAFAV